MAIHPAQYVTQAEIMAYLGFSDDQIDYLIDHDVPLSNALYNTFEYANVVHSQGFGIENSCRKLVKVDDDGYTDIDEFDNGLYMLSFEPHIKF